MRRQEARCCARMRRACQLLPRDPRVRGPSPHIVDPSSQFPAPSTSSGFRDTLVAVLLGTGSGRSERTGKQLQIPVASSQFRLPSSETRLVAVLLGTGSERSERTENAFPVSSYQPRLPTHFVFRSCRELEPSQRANWELVTLPLNPPPMSSPWVTSHGPAGA